MLILVRQIQKIADFVEYNGVETSHLVIELKLVNCGTLEEKGKQIDRMKKIYLVWVIFAYILAGCNGTRPVVLHLQILSSL